MNKKTILKWLCVCAFIQPSHAGSGQNGHAWFYALGSALIAGIGSFWGYRNLQKANKAAEKKELCCAQQLLNNKHCPHGALTPNSSFPAKMQEVHATNVKYINKYGWGHLRNRYNCPEEEAIDDKLRDIKGMWPALTMHHPISTQQTVNLGQSMHSLKEKIGFENNLAIKELEKRKPIIETDGRDSTCQENEKLEHKYNLRMQATCFVASLATLATGYFAYQSLKN